MNDINQVQSDVAGGMLSCSLFDDYNVVEVRKLRLQNVVDFAQLTMQARNGKVGCALAVEMPVFTVPDPNISGPQKLMTLSVLAIENPTINFNQTNGAQTTAEELAQLALDFLHHWMTQNAVAFTSDHTAIEPVTDFPNVVCYRIRVVLPRFRTSVARTKSPTVSLVANLVTLTPNPDDVAAPIWYTTDGSYPADKDRVPTATSTLYTGTITVTSGQTVRWAAYATNKFPSHVGDITAT